MLTVTRPSPTLRPHPPGISTPQIRSVAFSTATIRTGRIAVAKIDCTGIPPHDIHCESTSQGFDIEILPTRTRQGRFVIIGIRVHRRLGVHRSLCLLRFSAGPLGAVASVTVLP